MHVPRIALLLLVLNGPILADETAKTATGSVLHRIEPGRYHRGLSGGERELQRAFPYSVSAQFYGNSESPKHPVWVTKPFFISKTEVTVGEFRKFVEETRYVTTAEKSGTGIVTWAPTSADKPLYQSHDFERKAEANWKNPGFKQGDDHPVVGVSWDDAQAFLRWLSEKDGVKYRLPTEAEWELACRAGAKTWFSFGDVPRGEIHKHANIGNVELEKFRKHSVERQWLLDWENEPEDGYVFTAPVGKYEPNVFGLHDMHGNVWEWCQDLYLDTFYKKWDRGGYQDTVKLAIDPLNASEPQTPTNQFRAIRGGGWYNGPTIARAGNRGFWDQPDAACYIGFRIARNAEAPTRDSQDPWESEIAARKAIEARGGSFRAVDRYLQAVSMPFSRELIAQLTHLPDVRQLSLQTDGEVEIGQSEIDQLTALRDLELLNFSGAFNLERVNLGALRELEKLKDLQFSRSSSLTDADLEELSGLTTLESFRCYGAGGGLTDAGISQLKNNTNLRSLIISEADATGACLADFKNCPLEVLGLTCFKEAQHSLTDDYAKALANFPNLRELLLNEQGSIAEQTLLVCDGLKNLEIFNLQNAKSISKNGFGSLAGLQELRSLNLQGTQAGDGATAAIAKIPRLNELRIGSSNLSDHGLQALENSFSIENLTITESVATDDGLKSLGRINRLRRLEIRSPYITGSGLGPICKLPFLIDLKLPCPALTDIAFEHLSRAKTIQKIRLVERGVQPAAALTDNGLLKMKRATWLKELWLPRNDSGLTESVMEELKAAGVGVIPYTVDWERK